MRVVTAAQMRGIESAAALDWHLPPLIMMENAATGAAKHILRLLDNLRDTRRDKHAARVVVVSGPGNNGGDGFALARLLFAQGVKTAVIFTGDEAKVQGDARVNLDIVRRMGISFYTYPSGDTDASIPKLLRDADVVADAVFGTGLHRAPEGFFSEIISMINDCGHPVVSLDIPSGVDADTGCALGTAVKACLTVTFGFMKPGLLLYPGAELAGEVQVENISLPADCMPQDKHLMHALTDSEAATLLPCRPPDSHKGSYGRVVVAAGSRDMPGAAVLSCLAAYRTGAGLVDFRGVREAVQVVQRYLPEAVTRMLPGESGSVDMSACDAWSDTLKQAQKGVVWLIGPGLGRGEGVTKFVHTALLSARMPVVLDADGLNAAAEDVSVFKKMTAPCVLTPHPGEMSRLTGLTVTEITAEPVKTASGFARAHGVTVLLKGARSVIASPCGRVYINTSGCAAMAKAGSGDVLAGVIAGLTAQGMEVFYAAALGAYLHGRAGEIAAAHLSVYGVNARDIANALPEAMRLS